MGMTWDEWWKKNRDKVLQTRRKRYAEDASFRERQRTISRRDWEKKSQVLSLERKKNLIDKKKEVKVKKHLSPKRITIDGIAIMVHPLSKLSLELGKSSAYIKRITLKGILPKPTYIDKYNRYWYSDTYIKDVSGVFIDCRAKSWSLIKFKDSLMEKLVGYEW